MAASPEPRSPSAVVSRSDGADLDEDSPYVGSFTPLDLLVTPEDLTPTQDDEGHKSKKARGEESEDSMIIREELPKKGVSGGVEEETWPVETCMSETTLEPNSGGVQEAPKEALELREVEGEGDFVDPSQVSYGATPPVEDAPLEELVKAVLMTKCEILGLKTKDERLTKFKCIERLKEALGGRDSQNALELRLRNARKRGAAAAVDAA